MKPYIYLSLHMVRRLWAHSSRSSGFCGDTSDLGDDVTSRLAWLCVVTPVNLMHVQVILSSSSFLPSCLYLPFP